jgi:23S rRNA pseudouridine1911/1915/1917 synthase
VKKGERLARGAVVTIAVAAVPVVVPELRPLVILRVDEDLVALEKPGGLPMHPLRPGETGTLANALVAQFPECEAASIDPREAGFVHRLDVATGGLVLAARTRKSWEDWRGVMGEGDCLKTYLAEVAGAPPPHWSVDTPIGRHGRSGATVKLGGGRGALPAFTRFETLFSRGDRAVVSAELAHGRAHQVRAHLAASGFPILGDERYGTPASAATSRAHGVEGLHLWAHTLGATDPVTRLRRSWEAPPPTWAAAKFGA